MRATEPPGVPSVWGKGFSPRRASAKELPCPASEIEVSGYEEHYGSRSWTALCANQDYTCDWRDGKTTCESNTPPPPANVSSDRPYVMVRSREQPKTALLPTVGHFAFGDSRDHAQAVCEEKLMAWATNGTTSTCNEPDDSSSEGTHLTFCKSVLCRIEERSAPSKASGSAWISAFKKRRRELEAMYGPPNREARMLPRSCHDALHSCLENGTAELRYFWVWDNGTGIVLSMGGRSGAPAIRVVYDNSSKGTSGTR